MTEPTLKQRLIGTGVEVGGGIGTDFLTAGLLTGGPAGILAYVGINGFQGAYSNYLVQKHLYGAENVKWGEILASGALSAIPFMDLKAGKNIANIVGDANTVRRGLIGGAGFGLAGEQLRVGIDRGEFLSPLEAGLAVGIGGGLGGGLAKFGQQFEAGKAYAREGQGASKYLKQFDPTAATDDLISQRLGLRRRLFNSIDPEGEGASLGPLGDTRRHTKHLSREFGIVRTPEEALSKFWKGLKKGKPNRFYTLESTGEQLMVDLRHNTYNYLDIPTEPRLRDYTVVPYKTQNRYELRNVAQAYTRYGKIPPEVQVYFQNTYGKTKFNKFKKYITQKRNYNKQIKKELIEELELVKLNIEQSFKEARGIHESHFTAVKTKLTDTGYVAQNYLSKRKAPSKLFGGKNPKMLRNPPKTSGLWTSPNVDQLFLEYAKANIGRSNNPAVDIDNLLKLGIPTTWLESINTFLLQDDAPSLLQDFLMRQQINNYDLKDLVEGRLTADQIIEKTLERYFDDLYRTSPLDDLIAKIINNKTLTPEQQDERIEAILNEFSNYNLTKGMMSDPQTLRGGTKGGPVKVIKPKKDK